MSQTFTAGGHTHSIRARMGVGQEGPKLGLYKQEATQTSALGLALDVDDGSVYRYSHYVSAVAAGKIAALDISVAGFAPIDGKITNAAGAAADYDSDDSVIYATDTDTFQSENDAENVWAGGYLFVIDSESQGYKYRIKSHPQPEVNPAVAGTIKLVLHDKLEAALNSEASIAIIGHPYKNLAIANNGTDDLVAGIPIRAMTAAYYGWTQTWGWANCFLDESAGTIAAGTVAVLSDGVNGAAEPLNIAASNSESDVAILNFAEPILGHFGFAGTDTDFGPVFLRLNP